MNAKGGINSWPQESAKGAKADGAEKGFNHKIHEIHEKGS
jgi:hypothetical protein